MAFDGALYPWPGWAGGVEIAHVVDRSDRLGGWWLACGVPALLAGAWLWLLYARTTDAARQYDSAPWCNTLPSTADQSDCRYGLSATVTELHISSGKGSSYWMTLHGPPPADGRITFDAEPTVLEIAGIGDTVHAEVWRGQVVRVQFDGYSDATPAAPAYPVHRVLAWLVAAAVVAASLLCVGAGQRFGAWERRWYRGACGVLGIAAIAAGLAALFVQTDPTEVYPAYAIAGILLGVAGLIVVGTRWYGERRRAIALVDRAPVTWTSRPPTQRHAEPAVRPEPVVRRVLRAAWRLRVPSAALGLLATVLTGLALNWCVRSIQLAEAYHRAPVCGEPADGQCRRTVAAQVLQVRIVDGRDAQSWLYLNGPPPAYGPVEFRGSGPDFLRSLAAGDQVRAEVWRGRVTAVSGPGDSSPTLDAPGEDLGDALTGASAAFVAALLLLRWNARARGRRRGWRPIGTPYVEVGVVAVAATGCVLLGLAVPWGAALVRLALAALLCSTAVATLRPRRTPGTTGAAALPAFDPPMVRRRSSRAPARRRRKRARRKRGSGHP